MQIVVGFAIIYRQDSYGEGLLGAFKDNYGGEVAIEVPYNPEDFDAASIITQVVGSEPAAVLFIGFPETGVSIHQEATQFHPQDIYLTLLDH